MYRAARALGFRLDAEMAHAWALRSHRALRPLRRRRLGSRSVPVMGLDFPNVVGLAAGYDKDGRAWRGLAALRFGHIEVGTVTPRPQPGNPRPRVFRLPADEALVNRLGFPSDGADAVAQRLTGPRPDRLVLGVSIGPNGFTSTEAAADEYQLLLERFAPLADYLAVNISSPNTPGLRDLESGRQLHGLLTRLAVRRDALAGSLGRPVPLVVKLSPDIAGDDLKATVRAIESAGLDGIIVTNTTTQRPGLSTESSIESGGLSGAPLGPLSLSTLRSVRDMTGLPIISSGGIMTREDAAQRLDSGASLVQLYTGFVYHGPSLVRSVAALPPSSHAVARG